MHTIQLSDKDLRTVLRALSLSAVDMLDRVQRSGRDDKAIGLFLTWAQE
jgi:hypothetical protein